MAIRSSLTLPILATIISLVFSIPAYAGNWGQSWGAMAWGNIATALSVPVNNFLFLLAAILAVSVIGILKLRKT